MPKLRSNSNQTIDTAIEELVSLTANNRDLNIAALDSARVTIMVQQQSWQATIITRSSVSLHEMRVLVADMDASSMLIVADKISAEAKDFLSDTNRQLEILQWSWFDRRGELQLNHPGTCGVFHFKTATNSTRPQGWKLASPRSDGAIRGRSGISCAVALLLHPTNPPSIRSIARQAEMSHGAIGDASIRLREAGLTLKSGKPQIPELFWALAEVWNPTRVTPVEYLPTPENANQLNAEEDDLESSGWCLGGDDLAAAWGAPIVAGAVRPWIWVPEEGDARRLEQILHPTTWDDYAAVVAVPPTAIVCSTRVRPPTPVDLPFLPSVHPLFLALNLAQDPGRGREILEGWQPVLPEIHRVW